MIKILFIIGLLAATSINAQQYRGSIPRPQVQAAIIQQGQARASILEQANMDYTRQMYANRQAEAERATLAANPWKVDPAWRAYTNGVVKLNKSLETKGTELGLLRAAGLGDSERFNQVRISYESDQATLKQVSANKAKLEAQWRLKEFYKTHKVQ